MSKECPYCKTLAEVRVVQKEGPNKGRSFYVCPSCLGKDGNKGKFLNFKSELPRWKYQDEPLESETPPKKKQKTNNITAQINKDLKKDPECITVYLLSTLTTLCENIAKMETKLDLISDFVKKDATRIAENMNDLCTSVDPSTSEEE